MQQETLFKTKKKEALAIPPPTGECWTEGQIRLFCKDSRASDILPIDERYDFIVKDPMYKVKNTQNDYKPVRRKNQVEMEYLKPVCPPFDEYDAWFEAWIINCVAHVKPTGWIMIKMDDYTAYETWPIIKKYLRWANTIIWNKMIIGLGRLLRKQHELLMLCRPLSAKHSYFFGKNILQHHLKQTGFHGGSKGKAVSTVWTTVGVDEELDLDTVWDALGNNGGQLGTKVKKRHINETITDIWDKAIDVFVPPGGSILDLCMGSGSMPKAAKHKNRHCTGFEIQPAIFQKACENLHSAAGPSVSMDTFLLTEPEVTDLEAEITKQGGS